jgi:hypothetical protein
MTVASSHVKPALDLDVADLRFAAAGVKLEKFGGSRRGVKGLVQCF